MEKTTILKETIVRWKKNPEKPIRLIAFGSSNTELHWHSLGHFNWFSWLSASLREWIGRHITTINQGINGETTEDLIKRIDRDVISFSPNVVIITIGGNDANLKHSIDKYKGNLFQVIIIIQEAEILPILQTYYCPIYERMPEHFKIYKEFVQVNRNLAIEEKIPIIDQYKYFSQFYENNRSKYSELMLDGLHVNPLGNAIMGIVACRYFSLPDPVFMDRSFSKKVREYLILIKKNIELPPKTKRLKF